MRSGVLQGLEGLDELHVLSQKRASDPCGSLRAIPIFQALVSLSDLQPVCLSTSSGAIPLLDCGLLSQDGASNQEGKMFPGSTPWQQSTTTAGFAQVFPQLLWWTCWWLGHGEGMCAGGSRLDQKAVASFQQIAGEKATGEKDIVGFSAPSL